jgi:hypothetical protein
MAAIDCLSVFLMDNIVPFGSLASEFPNGASQNLLLVQIAFATGLIGLPIQIHFALRYCGIPGWSRLRLALLYGAFWVATAGAFSSFFLSARAAPLDERASLSCIVPWTPEPGVGSYAFLPIWILVQAILQVVLWRTKRLGRPVTHGPLSQMDLIRLGMGLQGLGVTVDCLMCATSLSCISAFPFTAVLAGLVYSAALVRERMTTDFPISTMVHE